MSDPLKPTADEETPALGVFDWIVAGTCLFVGGLTSYVVPKFEAILRDFDTEVPAVTQIFLSLPFYLWLVLGTAAAVAIVAKAHLLPPRANSLLNLLAVFLALAFFGLTILALWLPLKTLIEGLSK